MVELKTDRELLREYTEHGSGSAFQELVQRHMDLVFATVQRGVNEAGSAQEITQNVFIALARKAHWLRGESTLAGWLHKTALFEVRLWWRSELRRQRREQTAIELGTIMKDEDSLLKDLRGELDEGLLSLREPERQALMLRYFEGRSHKEIGALLGAREDAVRMRIDKALDRLTQFFRRRGYAVPAVATTAAVLGTAAKAAPAGLAAIAAQSALKAGSAGTATGIKLYIAKLMGLTKTQTAVLCAAIAVAPVAYEWNSNRVATNQIAAARLKLEGIRNQQEELSKEAGRLRADSDRLDAALTDAAQSATRYEAASLKLESLKARVHGLLTNGGHSWPEDLAYTRIPKSVVKSLDLLHKWPMAFGPSGAMTEQAVELFGITAQEKAPAEKALADYWHGVNDLSTANAYETNVTTDPSGRLTKTVVIPPLGQPLKDLAGNTAAQLTSILGSDREQLVFGDWDQGAIQTFAPGNLWKISEQQQNFTVWVEPSGADGSAPRFGSGWHVGGSGMSGDGPGMLSDLPAPIVSRFITPWLQQFGITNSISQ